jgi:hypothetical protein
VHLATRNADQTTGCRKLARVHPDARCLQDRLQRQQAQQPKSQELKSQKLKSNDECHEHAVGSALDSMLYKIKKAAMLVIAALHLD